MTPPLHKEEGFGTVPLLISPGEHEYANFVAAAQPR